MLGHGAELGIMGSFTHYSRFKGYSDFAGYFAPSYNINTKSNLYPYIEPFIGYASEGSFSQSVTANSGLGLGGETGLKIVIGTHSLIVIQVQYLHQKREYDINSFDPFTGDNIRGTISYSTNSIFTGAGFRLFFGGKTVK